MRYRRSSWTGFHVRRQLGRIQSEAAGFKTWGAYCASGRIDYSVSYADRVIRCAELRPKIGTIVPMDTDWTQHQMLELCKCETDNDAALSRDLPVSTIGGGINPTPDFLSPAARTRPRVATQNPVSDAGFNSPRSSHARCNKTIAAGGRLYTEATTDDPSGGRCVMLARIQIGGRWTMGAAAIRAGVGYTLSTLFDAISAIGAIAEKRLR